MVYTDATMLSKARQLLTNLSHKGLPVFDVNKA